MSLKTSARPISFNQSKLQPFPRFRRSTASTGSTLIAIHFPVAPFLESWRAGTSQAQIIIADLGARATGLGGGISSPAGSCSLPFVRVALF